VKNHAVINEVADFKVRLHGAAFGECSFRNTAGTLKVAALTTGARRTGKDGVDVKKSRPWSVLHHFFSVLRERNGEEWVRALTQLAFRSATSLFVPRARTGRPKK